MIVVVASIPRAGSMWTYNVCRSILSLSGVTVLPELIPPDETGLLPQAMKNNSNSSVYCIKTHKMVTSGLTGVKLLFTHRDIREAIFSYIRFTKCDFDLSMNVVRGMMKTIDHYYENYPSEIYRIDFASILDAPVEKIAEIGKFLNIDIDKNQCEKLSDMHSRENVRKQIEAMSKIKISTDGVLFDKNDRYEAIKNFDGTYRCYDKRTGFQTNHASTSGGMWRSGLSQEKQDILLDITDAWSENFLKKYS